MLRSHHPQPGQCLCRRNGCLISRLGQLQKERATPTRQGPGDGGQCQHKGRTKVSTGKSGRGWRIRCCPRFHLVPSASRWGSGRCEHQHPEGRDMRGSTRCRGLWHCDCPNACAISHGGVGCALPCGRVRERRRDPLLEGCRGMADGRTS